MDPKALAKLLIWLAALGAVVLLATKVVGTTARKAVSVA